MMKNSDYKTEIGERIKAAREAKKLSLEGLSQATGGLLSKSRIGNYEQGERMPGPEEVNILGSVLDVAPAYLMCLALEWNKHQLDFLKNWMTLPENVREEYFDRLESLSLAYRKPLPDEKLTAGYRSPAPHQNPVSQVRRTQRHPVRKPR